VERNEPTSGGTRHFAARVAHFGMNRTAVGLKAHSIRSLRKSCPKTRNILSTAAARMAAFALPIPEAQMRGYRHFASIARGMDVRFEVIDAEKRARRHPSISTADPLGGPWDPLDGDIDPARPVSGAGISCAQGSRGATETMPDAWRFRARPVADAAVCGPTPREPPKEPLSRENRKRERYFDTNIPIAFYLTCRTGNG